jgi:hypothetical protein
MKFAYFSGQHINFTEEFYFLLPLWLIMLNLEIKNSRTEHIAHVFKVHNIDN